MTQHRVYASGQCSESGLKSNLKLWHKQGYKVIYSTANAATPHPSLSAPAALLNLCATGVRIVISNDALGRTVSIVKDSDKQELWFKYEYTSICSITRRTPVGCAESSLY